MPDLVSTVMGNHLLAGKPPRFETSHLGQLSLLPLAGWKMSTGQSGMMLCSCGIKTGMVEKRGWQVKLCDPSLTHAIPERLQMKYHNIVVYKN